MKPFHKIPRSPEGLEVKGDGKYLGSIHEMDMYYSPSRRRVYRVRSNRVTHLTLTKKELIDGKIRSIRLLSSEMFEIYNFALSEIHKIMNDPSISPNPKISV